MKLRHHVARGQSLKAGCGQFALKSGRPWAPSQNQAVPVGRDALPRGIHVSAGTTIRVIARVRRTARMPAKMTTMSEHGFSREGLRRLSDGELVRLLRTTARIYPRRIVARQLAPLSRWWERGAVRSACPGGAVAFTSR